MAIGSAAIPFNIDFVLDQLDIRKYFSAIVSADDVGISKPHPETFLKAAKLLHANHRLAWYSKMLQKEWKLPTLPA